LLGLQHRLRGLGNVLAIEDLESLLQ